MGSCSHLYKLRSRTIRWELKPGVSVESGSTGAAGQCPAHVASLAVQIDECQRNEGRCFWRSHGKVEGGPWETLLPWLAFQDFPSGGQAWYCPHGLLSPRACSVSCALLLAPEQVFPSGCWFFGFEAPIPAASCDFLAVHFLWLGFHPGNGQLSMRKGVICDVTLLCYKGMSLCFSTLRSCPCSEGLMCEVTSHCGWWSRECS